jgi:Tol biopolymer transport system component
VNERRDLDLELVLGRWMEASAEPLSTDALEGVLWTTQRTRQRPAWSFPARWLPARLAAWTPAPTPDGRLLLVLALLVLAVVAATFAAGSLRRLPTPFGLARPGLVALDIDHHIVVMNADGSGRLTLTSGNEADTSPVWSPDGRRLAFWRITGSGRWSIVIASASGAVTALVVTSAPSPPLLPPDDPGWSSVGYALGAPSFLQWAPDSDMLAFSQDTKGIPGVWTVRADGSGLARVGDPRLAAADPCWSPDGSRIAFHGGPGWGPENGVYVMRSDGGTVDQVSHVSGTGYSYSYPQWQPGGELIAFIADAGAGMHIDVVQADGIGERDISQALDLPGDNDWIPRWSPDGSRIAFQHYPAALGTSSGQVAIVELDGSNAFIPPGQPENVGGPMWAPDGRTVSALIHTATDTSAIMTLDLVSGRPPLIVPAAGNSGGTSWQRLAP